MRKICGFGLALVLLGGVSGCGSSAESMTKDMIKDLNELADTLEGIKDNASAEEAIPKIEKITAHMKELGKKMKDTKISKDEEKKLQEKYGAELLKAFARVGAAQGKAMAAAPTKMPQIQKALSATKGAM